jgi:hypothetical protein
MVLLLFLFDLDVRGVLAGLLQGRSCWVEQLLHGAKNRKDQTH